MYKILVFVILLTGFTLCAQAQRPDTVKVRSQTAITDSLNRVRDSLTSKPFVPRPSKKMKEYHPDSTHSPGLAFRRSGYVPGWGQIYNHHWWKVPFIYAGLGLLGRSIVTSRQDYKTYLGAAKIARSGTGPGSGVDVNSKAYKDYQYFTSLGATSAQLEQAVTTADRNFQISILSFVGVWGIQMIEAYIDAKFIHSYTMDNNLSFKVSPGLMPASTAYASNYSYSYMPVVKLTLSLK